MAAFLPSGSDEELDLVLFVLLATHQWSEGSVEEWAEVLIRLFQEAWAHFAKTGPADGQFNKWWNADCAQAKHDYNLHPCHCHCLAFQSACKAAKKAYFAGKLEDMVKYCKPWTGMRWIKDRPIPKVPQIHTQQGHMINELHPMFEVFQHQFQPELKGRVDLSHPFLSVLPTKPT